jgi:hypothetical protein
METRIVRPRAGARVIDPRTRRPLPTEAAPAEDAKGKPVELPRLGTEVIWDSYWMRRFVPDGMGSGSIEVRRGDGWDHLERRAPTAAEVSERIADGMAAEQARSRPVLAKVHEPDSAPKAAAVKAKE